MIVGLEVPMDYHLLFLAMSFIVFLITIILLFIETTFEKSVGAFILCAFNIMLSLLCAYLFSAVDIYGYTSEGVLVHNVSGGMSSLTVVFYIMIYLNIMLMVYCSYLFIKKPWSEGIENETQYQDFYY